jgi:hypothetical protein
MLSVQKHDQRSDIMKRKALHWLLPVALLCGTSVQTFGDPEQDKDKKEKKEIGSDPNTGGPTQKDRDTMRDIQQKTKDLKEKQQNEKKEREKAKEKAKNGS